MRCTLASAHAPALAHAVPHLGARCSRHSYFNFNGTSVNHTHFRPGSPPEKWKEMLVIVGSVALFVIVVAAVGLYCYRLRRARQYNMVKALRRKGGRAETRPLLAAHGMHHEKGDGGAGSPSAMNDPEHSQLMLSASCLESAWLVQRLWLVPPGVHALVVHG